MFIKSFGSMMLSKYIFLFYVIDLCNHSPNIRYMKNFRIASLISLVIIIIQINSNEELNN